MRRRALRAAPRASCRITAMRLDPSRTYAPAALRALLASRGKPCGLSPPRRLGAPQYPEPACAGSARPAPRRIGSARRVRQGLLRQVVRMHVACDAGGSLPVCHEGRFTDGRSALLGVPRRALGMAACWDGACSCQSLGMALPSQGRAVEAFVRGCRAGHASFRIGGGSAQGVLVLL